MLKNSSLVPLKKTLAYTTYKFYIDFHTESNSFENLKKKHFNVHIYILQNSLQLNFLQIMLQSYQCSLVQYK